MMVQTPLLTVPEVAQQLRVRSETVRRWLRSGRIQGVMMGGYTAGWRIPESEVRRLVAQGPLPGQEVRVTPLRSRHATSISSRSLRSVRPGKEGSWITVALLGGDTMIVPVNETPDEIHAQLLGMDDTFSDEPYGDELFDEEDRP